MAPHQPSPLERRVAAAQLLLDAWKGRPFSWSAGHCIRLVAEHLKRMGYRPPLERAGSFSTAIGAGRAMRRAGVANLSDAVDLVPGLVRIAPAAALVADIVELEAEPPFSALAVAMGNGRVLGFHQDLAGAGLLEPRSFVGAWRVDPR